MYKLNSIMMKRIDTFESDILKLWDSFKNARDPSQICGAKMRAMEQGTFIGKAPKRYYNEKPLKDFFKKQNIDSLCKDSLADALYDRRLQIIRERKLQGPGLGLKQDNVTELATRWIQQIEKNVMLRAEKCLRSIVFLI